ncbi:MAG: phosphohistidine phosphatase SixA [Phycisphaerales bacterium]|nr:phosphohistidine phosphatase SixA [Phycisphaerales bacterium]
MRLYIMRHGIAADPDPAGLGSDAERELTPAGRRKTRRAARGLARVVSRMDHILTSPLRRAVQTAELAAAAFGVPPERVRRSATLEPGAAFADLFRELADYPADSAILLVGHEPHLSGLISFLLSGDADAVDVCMKKCTVAALDVGSIPPKQPASLRFLLQPRQLRELGG